MENEILKRLEEKYGTPLYVYDSNTIQKQVQKLKDIFPPYVKILYSIKANPNIGIISYLKDKVDGIEVASEGELFRTMYAGVSPQNIIFVGPGKTKEEIEYAIHSEIFCIVSESIKELVDINHIAHQQNKRIRVAVRINPKKESKSSRIKMGGTSKQFGIDEEKIGEVLENIKNLLNVKMIGIHVYGGTQNLNSIMLVEQFRDIFNIAKSIKEKHKIEIDFIDFGGGFGIPYFEGESELDLDLLKIEFSKLFNEYSKFFDYNHMKLFVESGRFIIGECGYFLTKILYKKYSRGKTYLIVDGGSNHHAQAAGMGRFIRNNFPATVIHTVSENITEVVDVVGPLCTPTDLLLHNVQLPLCKEGDVIVIHKSGGYGLSASMTDFLSHPKPVEVLIMDGKDYLIRERGKREDFIVYQNRICDLVGKNMDL